MLTVDVEKRLNMSEIINHKWLKFDSDLSGSSNFSNRNTNTVNALFSSPATLTSKAAATTAKSSESSPLDTQVYKEFRNLIDRIETMLERIF